MRRNPGWLVGVVVCAACNDAVLPVDNSDLTGLGIAGATGAGAVFVASNAAGGNAVLVFGRNGDGTLEPAESHPTGGLGTGSGLGNQGGLVLARGDRLLYVVNAGSDQISGFRLTGSSIELLGTFPSGGDLPISLSVSGDLLYVLHDGTDPNVTGFRIGSDGSLTSMAGSTRPLSGAAPDAAQLGFSPDGSRLVVTEKVPNQILTFPVQGDGSLGPPTVQAAAGAGPFGFGFDRRGHLFVSETFGGAPDGSTVSSYRAGNGGWIAVSPTTPTTETAACWVVVTGNGRYLYTTNTGSASVTGFAIGQDGSLTLLNPDGVTGSAGTGPIDADVSVDSRYLYVLNSGSHSISGFRIGSDGSLTPSGSTTGLPAGANGLVAR